MSSEGGGRVSDVLWLLLQGRVFDGLKGGDGGGVSGRGMVCQISSSGSESMDFGGAAVLAASSTLLSEVLVSNSLSDCSV